MDFYTALSSYYDDIFQTNEKAIQLIKKKVKGTRLLDLAAGTGEEAIELAKAGYEVTATDLNDQMVEIMKSKIKLRNLPLVIKKMDMNLLGEAPEAGFDGIYCIGNSFVHLQNRQKMIRLLNTAYEKLNKNGVFIIQVVNYDRIYSQKINQLPTIENKEKGLIFERFYKAEDDHFRFRMRLTIENEAMSDVLESETPLSPLTKDSFVSILESSAFQKYNIFGNFHMGEFTTNSPALVAVLTKE
ncbi:class I SAM-dependent methyltransferase [Salipaludibacillus daqingensis]|uniref:class I SAM-dependent methyltransferase n=1 Tax=Salipaludibacillus daqingensis TaxID=3041001 RepID=UPI0024751295|nr:class I SAM-dependent methyltransferase [Salipaludibacillus daqingensis]